VFASDAKSDGQHDGRAEGGARAHQPPCVRQVSNHAVDDREALLLPERLLGLDHAAELAHRGGSRVRLGHSGTQVLFNRHLQVRADFEVEVPIPARPAPPAAIGSETREDFPHAIHRPLSR
jgi:hypothetical protein